MGGGAWTSRSYVNTIAATYNVSNSIDILNMTTEQVFRSSALDPALNPRGVMRECRDSEEHPNTVPVILALDVTGSMGKAARACAAKLDEIMTELYGKVTDVEFLMMGIGDLAYDNGPIQASQFESDIRILDQTMKIWFEGGGGGNSWESYTAAWYFGLHNCDLDCWKRGKKGIIITLGDEPLNPYLPGRTLTAVLDIHSEDVDTKALYEQAREKYDIHHIAITDKEASFEWYAEKIRKSFGELLGDNYHESSCDGLAKMISDIVIGAQSEGSGFGTGIRW